MNKPEVQLLIPLILSRLKILDPLLLRHGIPLLLTVFVPQNVIHLDEEEQEEIPCGEGDQDFVAIAVWIGFISEISCLIEREERLTKRRILSTVDIGLDDESYIAHHVIHRSA